MFFATINWLGILTMAKNGSSQYIKNDDTYTWFICVILYEYFVLNKSSPYSTVC